MRLPEGLLGSATAPVAVQIGTATGGGVSPLDVSIAGPSAERPAVLEGVSFQLFARRALFENVTLTQSRRTAINATVTDEVALRGTVVAGARIADPTQETVMTISIAPGHDGRVVLESSWLVDNGGPRAVQGLLVRSGSDGSATLELVGSGFVANQVVHELVVDGARRVELDDAVVVGPAQPWETAGGVLLSAGTELAVRRSVVAPGKGRTLVDPRSGHVPLEVDRSYVVAAGDDLAALVDSGFEPLDDEGALEAAAALTAEGAMSAERVRERLAPLLSR